MLQFQYCSGFPVQCDWEHVDKRMKDIPDGR